MAKRRQKNPRRVTHTDGADMAGHVFPYAQPRTPAKTLNEQFGVSGKDEFKEIAPGVFHSLAGFSPEELKAKTEGGVKRITNFKAGELRGQTDDGTPVKVRFKKRASGKRASAFDPALLNVLKKFLAEQLKPGSKLAQQVRDGNRIDLGGGFAISFSDIVDDEADVILETPTTEPLTQEEFKALLEHAAGVKTQPLHQTFYRWTFKDSATRLGVPATDPRIRQAYRNYQTMVKTAQRFVITNDALEEVYHLSQNVEKLYERSPLALIPFDTVWIEYDSHERIRLSREFGTAMYDPDLDLDNYDGIPKRCGFLLKQLYPDRADAWVVFKVTEMSDGAAELIPIGQVFDAQSEERIKGKVGGWDTIRRFIDVDGLIETAAGAGHTEGLEAWDKLNQFAWGVFGDATETTPAMPFLADMTGYIMEPMWQRVVESAMDGGRSVRKMELLANLMVEAIREHAGDMRFLVNLLAFMNEVPIILNPVEPKGSFAAGGKMQPFFSHRTVQVNIPAKHRKQRRGEIAKIIAKAVKHHKRAHRVRAHVRRYYKEGMLYKQTTVKSHIRGNAALGWVHQDYEVTAK